MRKHKTFLGMASIFLFMMLPEVNNAAPITLPRYFTVPIGEVLDLTQYEMEIQKKESLLPSETPKLTWSLQEDQEGSEFFINEKQLIANRVGWISGCVNEENKAEEVCLPILVTDDDHEVIQEADRLTYIERDLPIIWAHDIQGNSEEALAQIVKEHIKFSDVHIPEASRNRMLEVEDIDPNHLSVISDYQEGDTWADISVFLDGAMIYQDVLTIIDERYKPEGDGWEPFHVQKKICPPVTYVQDDVYIGYGANISGLSDEYYEISDWGEVGRGGQFPCVKQGKLWLKKDITVYNPLNNSYAQFFGMGRYEYPLEFFTQYSQKPKYIIRDSTVGRFSWLPFEDEFNKISYSSVHSPVILPFYSVRSSQNTSFSRNYGRETDVYFLVKQEGNKRSKELIFPYIGAYGQGYDADVNKTINDDVNIWVKKNNNNLIEGLSVNKPFTSFEKDKYVFSSTLEYNVDTGFFNLEQRIYNENDSPRTLALIDLKMFNPAAFVGKFSQDKKFDLINVDGKNVGFKKQYNFGYYIDGDYIKYGYGKGPSNSWYFQKFDEDTNLNWTVVNTHNIAASCSYDNKQCIMTYYDDLVSGKDLGAFYKPNFTFDFEEPSVLAVTPTQTIKPGQFLSQKIFLMIGEDYRLKLTATPSQVEVYGDELQSDTEQQVNLTTKDSSGKAVGQLNLYVNGQQEPDKVASQTSYIIEFPKAPIGPGVEMREYTFQTRLVKDKIYPSNSVTVPVSTYTFGATFSGVYYATSGQNIDPNEISKLLNTYYIKNRGGEPSYQWVDSKKCSIKNNTLDLNGSNQIIVPSNSNGKKYEACLEMIQQEEDITRSFNVKIPIEVVDKIPAGKQLYFEQSDVIIDKDFKDHSEYVQGNQLLELSQPFIKEGNKITSSYKQAPFSFKVKSITFNDDQTSGTAEICYMSNLCDSINFNEQSRLMLKFKQALITMPKDLSNQKNDPDLNTVFLYKSQPYIVDENNEHKASIDYEDDKDRFSANIISIDESNNGAKVQVCYEDTVCSELSIKLTDTDKFVEWTKMKGTYNTSDKNLIIYGGETSLDVPSVSKGDGHQSMLFLNFSNIIDTSTNTEVRRENIRFVNFINQVKIKKTKYGGNIQKPTLNGMFSYGSNIDKRPKAGFLNLEGVTGWDYFVADESVNIDTLFYDNSYETKSIISMVDLSDLNITVEGNHDYYSKRNVSFTSSFYRFSIKTVIFPPDIDETDVINLQESFHRNIELIKFPPGYQFDVKMSNMAGEWVQLSETGEKNIFNPKEEKGKIVDTQEAKDYVTVYRKNAQQLKFEKSTITIPSSIPDGGKELYILEQTQPYVFVGTDIKKNPEGSLLLASYKDELKKDQFSVKDIESTKAKVCYEENLCRDIDIVSFTNPQVLVPSTLNFENLTLPIQEPGTSYRADKDWDIKVVNVDKLQPYKVVISQQDYFSLNNKKLKEGINIVYKDNQQEQVLGLKENNEENNIFISSEDFKSCDGNQYCTQWDKNQGLILKYNTDLNNPLRDCNKSSSCKYQATLEFKLESAF